MATEEKTPEVTQESTKEEAPAEKGDEKIAEDVDETKLAINMLAQGKRNVICGEIPVAVNQFQEACAVLAKKYGETATECAEAYFCYGQSLLDLARMETGVLGNALQGVDVDTEDDTEEKEAVKDEQFEKPENLEETGESSATKDDKETEEEEGEDEGDEEEEEEAAEGAEGTCEPKEGEEDGDDVSNLQLAWEMLELAKMIYLKVTTKESQLKAAQAYLKLGEVSLETEQYEQATEDFKACLEIQQKHLEATDRLLAESHYQLGLAFGFDKKYEESVEHYKAAIKVIEEKICHLEKVIEENSTGKGKELSSSDDPVTQATKEISELKEILPDIASKIEDAEEEKKNLEQLKTMTKEIVGGTLTTFTSESEKKTETAKPIEVKKASDISHLIRRKRKPDEDADDPESKKSRQEDGSGDAPRENGHDKPAAAADSTEKKEDTPDVVPEAEPMAT